MEFLKNITYIVVIKVVFTIVAAFFLIMASQRLLPWLAKNLSGRYRLHVLASVPVFRLLITLVAALIITISIIEPTFKNLVALLGAIGIALGFAFKDYASSLIAGVVAVYERPYRLGDWVSIEGTYGEVISIGMRSFEIRTPDDTVVVIPNLKLWSEKIFNSNDGGHDLQCAADFYLHPEHDPQAITKTLLDIGWTSPYLNVIKPVSVVVLEKPWGTQYRLKAYPVNMRDQINFTTDLTTRGKKALIGLGIQFSVMPPVIKQE